MIEIAANKSNEKKREQRPRINNQITADSVMLIGSDGEKIGVLGIDDALDAAAGEGLDLVEVSSGANPPVCRIMDYGKFLYDRQKKERESRKNSKTRQLKEMKFRCRIGDGDYNTKKKHIIRFIEDGNPVRITIMFRGREMSHPDLGMDILDKLAGDLEDLVDVQVPPKMEGRNMTMTVVPKTKK